jgi:hypothetical protein
MWKPQRLTTLWLFSACCKDNFHVYIFITIILFKPKYLLYLTYPLNESRECSLAALNQQYRAEIASRKCVRYAASRSLETTRKIPIPARVRASRLNEIAVHHVYELDSRFAQLWFIFWSITHAELAACFLLVDFLFTLQPWRCRSCVLPKRWRVSIHDKAYRPRN